MEKDRIKKVLVEIYNDYQRYVIRQEERGNGKYTDEDFDSLSKFIQFIHNS